MLACWWEFERTRLKPFREEGNSMELKDVLYEKRERIAWVTLNRPHALNALTAEMMRSLGLAAEDARDDDTVRALVITGAGRAFCAGADIRLMDNATLENFRDFLTLLTDVWTRSEEHTSELQ